MTDAEPPTVPSERRQEIHQALQGAKVRPLEPDAGVTFTVGDVHPREEASVRHLWVQELARLGLAIAFFLLLAATIAWALSQIGSTTSWTNAKEALQILLPVETTLVGASTAFYYRSRRDD